MEKLLNDEFWNKLPQNFILVKEEDYGRFKDISPEATPERIYKFEDEYIVFNAIKDWEEFVKMYDDNLSEIEKIAKTGDWRKTTLIKPIFHGWKNIKGKQFYFSIFESYNSNEKLSVQIFSEYDGVLVSASTSAKKENEMSFETIFNNNKFIKGIIRVFL